MIAVIFEVEPKPSHRQAYFDLANALRPRLEQIDGFISVERFSSITRPERILSLSFWRDEAAVIEWRNLSTHRAAQSQGREAIFHDYRLRVATVIRDYGMFERHQAPTDSQRHHGSMVESTRQ